MRSIIIALALLPITAFSHEWYDAECCSTKDCKPVPTESVRWTTSGWLIVDTGEIIPEDSRKVRYSQDNQFHRCSRHFAYSNVPDRTICLYVPGAGV